MRILPSQSTGTNAKVGSSALVDDRQVEVVALGNGRPVGDAGAAERIDPEPQAARADRVEVDDRGQVVDVGGDVVVAVHRSGRRRPRASTPSRPASSSSFASRSIHDVTSVPAGPAVGRVVLEAAVLGRVVRGRDDDPVGGPRSAAAVVGQDRVRDRRRGGEAVVGVDHHVDLVGAQHLEDRAEGRLRQRVGVAPQEQRAVDALRAAVAADGLADRQHVRLVERARRRAAAVPGGAERDALLGHRRVGLLVVVGAHEPIDVDQARRVRRAPARGLTLMSARRSQVADQAVRAGRQVHRGGVDARAAGRLARSAAPSWPASSSPQSAGAVASPDSAGLRSLPPSVSS